ncbi:MAG: hypothetical protein ACRCY6_05665 [Bacteroidales bacterium]
MKNFKVKNTLFALLMSVVALTACDKNDDTPAVTLSLVEELKSYVGLSKDKIDNTMQTKELARYEIDDETLLYGEVSFDDKGDIITRDAYSFEFSNGEVINAIYGIIVIDKDKKEDCLRRFETWGEECTALGYNGKYEGLVILKNDTSIHFYSERTQFKECYNTNRDELTWAIEDTENSNREYVDCCFINDSNFLLINVGAGKHDDSRSSTFRSKTMRIENSLNK